jgi:hypothetical protein
VPLNTIRRTSDGWRDSVATDAGSLSLLMCVAGKGRPCGAPIVAGAPVDKAAWPPGCFPRAVVLHTLKVA